MWGKVRRDVRGVKKCGERYGGCGKVCWVWGEVRRDLGKGMGGVRKGKGRCGGVKKCGGSVAERMG